MATPSDPNHLTAFPWRVSRDQTGAERLRIEGGNGRSIASVWIKDEAEAWADAHMMKAAPTMYEALVYVAHKLGGDPIVEAALAKA